MSELINTRQHVEFRLKLLTTASALVLLTYISSNNVALADDADRPTVWIELGGQLERVNADQQPYVPPFAEVFTDNGFADTSVGQKPPFYANGLEGKLSAQPRGATWTFSASLRYGRSNASRTVHEQTAPASAHIILSVPALNVYQRSPVPPRAERFADTTSKLSSSYLVLDFQAGKDVGIGSFGSLETSVIDVGIRAVQFSANRKISIAANPDFKFYYHSVTQMRRYGSGYIPFYIKFPYQNWHINAGSNLETNDFRGIGPSLSWNASAVLAGNPNSATFAVDWGINGSVLIGRQKVRATHETTSRLETPNLSNAVAMPIVYQHSTHIARNRTVVVPNVGGFAGLSYRYNNAKLSIGYRADFFFAAMDGGIDARKTYDRNFYGPFATISVGLGG